MIGLYRHICMIKIFILFRYVDSKCPFTCKSCPELIFLHRPPVSQLTTPKSSFSNHSYEDRAECLAAEAVGSAAAVFNSINITSRNNSNYSDNSNNSINDPTAAQPMACHDVQSACAEIAAMDQCDDYPV